MPGQIVVLMVTALIENRGKYLVLKRSRKNFTNKGKWQFPEGKVKFGEELEKALKREVEEETNLVVTDAKIVGIHSSILRRTKSIFRMFRTVFSCKVVGKIKLSRDHNEYRWIDKKELEKLNFIEGFNPNNIISVKKLI
jgi:8-oxo-dGTP diphosphatase